jgi:hypothetical protein
VDKRVCGEKWEVPIRETEYRRPWRRVGRITEEIGRVGQSWRTWAACWGRVPLSPLALYRRSLNFRVTSTTHTPMSSSSSSNKKPVCIIAIGMAGSGKSTFVQRLNAHLHSQAPPAPPYVLNLDPAVANLPFEANIDIRDTVDYHEVMKQCALAVPLCFLPRPEVVLSKVQSGSQRRYPHSTQPLHNKVRPGPRPCREACRDSGVRFRVLLFPQGTLS